MDRFRIIALEKIVQNSTISSEYKIAAIHTLLEKIDIYIHGATKRGKKDDIELYEGKRVKYKEILDARYSILDGMNSE
jgi:hypothetical protein